MSAFDKNKIFFALVHYILSEQHNVDWILKTSLVNFTGLNTTISNKKFKQNSVTDDIIEYIYQIKPYHVQFEQFIEKHSSKDDVARIEATDVNNAEISIRFDAIQPYSDIDITFYEYYPIDYENVDPVTHLPRYKEDSKENIEGLLIFSEIFNKFFERHYDEDLEKWVWVEKDYELYSDKYYYSTKSDEIYKVIKDNDYKTLSKFTDDDLFNFLNTHKANRVWYNKRTVFTNETEMKDYIVDVLNAHFKGISIDGSKFDFGNMGYEAFLYDEKLYDEPTISNDYCLVNFKEPRIKYKYTKTFVKVGVKTLLLDVDEEILEGNCQVFYEYGDESGEITNFSIIDNMVRLPYSLRMYEKIKVINTVDDVRTGYIFVGHPYLENDDMDDTLIRKFVDITTDRFEIPENNIGSRKVLVYLIKPNGSKRIISEFEEKDGCVILSNPLYENDRVQVTVIDFRRIYDKIYTYEDIYGNSNNIVSVDGNKFLRANYEAGRPSELAVSYPIDGSMIYKETKNGEQELYQINWKNDHDKLTLSPTMQTELTESLTVGDTYIRVKNGSRLYKPQMGRTKKIIPGKILINSEIIEYHKLTMEGTEGVLSGIRRASSGTILNEFLPVGTVVTAYPDQAMISYNPRSMYISTLFKEGMENKFIIPGKVLDNSKVIVYKKSHINLLSDIKFSSKYFDISSNNIILPTEDETGRIYINDDIIYFKTITENRGKYRIKNFHIDKEYKTSESIIYAKDYEIVDREDYEIINNQEEDERLLMYVKENCVYNPQDDSQMGIYLEENDKKVVYGTNNQEKKYYIGELVGSQIKKDGEVVGRQSPEWDNLVLDLNEDEDIVIGYILENGKAYSFDKREKNIIGYVNDREEIVNENDEIIEYPYAVKYKDAYVILNETPRPLECIIIGNEK